jgi:hypothetical protein
MPRERYANPDEKGRRRLQMQRKRKRKSKQPRPTPNFWTSSRVKT